jgi:hypothetical protein
MRFVLTVDIPDEVHEPGIPIAQIMREVEPVVEAASPLANGKLLDRQSGATRAEWTVFGGVPLATAPIITSYGPNPGPVGEGTFGFSLTGNFFPQGAVLYIDGAPVQTDVYSQWSITGNAPMQAQPGTAKAMLVFDGLGYAHFDWVFGAAEVSHT